MKNMSNWRTGAGNPIEFDEIVQIIKKHSKQNGKLSIGTDSHIKKRDCIFSTAICLYGASNQLGGRYFIRRNSFKKAKFPTLIQRITAEVQKSIELGMRLLELNPVIDIEIHLDISASNKEEGTSKFSDMLVGYAKGAGFTTRIKPDAPAASTVADKHSK